MKHRVPALLLCLLVASASLGAQQAYPIRVVDDAGYALTLPSRPTRIASLTLTTDEVLLGMGVAPRLVAVTNQSADPSISNVVDLAAGVAHKLDMNVEAILSLSPDLVLVANWSDPGPVQQLRNAGIPVYLMASGVTIASIEEKIARLALLVGEPEKGRQMVAGMEERLREVAQRVAAVPAKERLSVIDYGSWGGAMGKGSSWDEVVTRAGLIDAVAGLGSDEWGQVPLSREKLLTLDPDLLVLPGSIYSNPKAASAFYAQVTQDPSLHGLRAVRSGRVYQMPEPLKGTTSQFIARAVEWLARTAYPRAFPQGVP